MCPFFAPFFYPEPLFFCDFFQNQREKPLGCSHNIINIFSIADVKEEKK